MMTMFKRFGAHLDTSNICTGDDPLHWNIYWASDEMRWSESRESRDDLWFRGSNIALLSMICIGTFALEFYLYKLYPPGFFSRFQIFLFITTTLHEFRFVSNHHQLLRLCITLFRLVIETLHLCITTYLAKFHHEEPVMWKAFLCASWQICIIAFCACAENTGNVFPTMGWRSRHASRHVLDARAVKHAGIAN